MALEQDDAERLAFYRARAEHLDPRSKATFRNSDSGRNVIAAAGAWWPSIYLGDDIGYNGDPGKGSVETA